MVKFLALNIWLKDGIWVRSVDECYYMGWENKALCSIEASLYSRCITAEKVGISFRGYSTSILHCTVGTMIGITGITVVLIVVRLSNMVYFARHENVQLLHHMMSFVGVSLRTACKKIARIDEETNRLAQASLSEIPIYSILWWYYVLW